MLGCKLAGVVISKRCAGSGCGTCRGERVVLGRRLFFTAFVKNDWNFNSVLKYVILNDA